MEITVDIIRKKGKFLNCGVSRRVYKYKGKVYKIDNEEDELLVTQTSVEKAIYTLIPDCFKCLFPNPKWLEDTVVEMEEVQVAWDILKVPNAQRQKTVEDVSKDLPFLIQRTRTIELLIQEGLEEQLPIILNFIEWAESKNIKLWDIFDNAGNFGLKNSQFKIIDWGLVGYN